MKITNFRNLRQIKESVPGTIFPEVMTIKITLLAEVDVETTYYKWFRKHTKVETKTVYRSSAFWKFLDTGEYAPSTVVEDLEEVFRIKKKLANENH